MQEKLIISVFSLAMIFAIAGIVFAGPAAELPGDINPGTVNGRILLKDGSAMVGGQIMFYNVLTGPPPLPDKYERTPDITRDIDASGSFKVNLPPGKYYIGALKRISGGRFGPPQPGDIVFRSLDEKRRPKEYVVKAGEILDLGTLSGAFPLTTEKFLNREVTTAIEGKIFDMGMRPVKDAVVVAFTEPSLKGKPLFISDKSDKDGKYIFRLTPGTYYLMVRNSFASGPPRKGEIVGYYGEGRPAPVTIKQGEIIKGFHFAVITFPGRGPFSQMGPKRPRSPE